MARKTHKTDRRTAAQKAASARHGAITREIYFSQAGATLAGYRGIHTVRTDRKKAASKKACRGRF